MVLITSPDRAGAKQELLPFYLELIGGVFSWSFTSQSRSLAAYASSFSFLTDFEFQSSAISPESWKEGYFGQASRMPVCAAGTTEKIAGGQERKSFGTKGA